MNWIKTKNNTKINLNEIPTLDICELREEIISLNKRPVGFFWERLGIFKDKTFCYIGR